MTFLGVYLITSGRSGQQDDEGGLEDEENAIGLIDEEGYQDELGAQDSSRRQSSLRFDDSSRRPSKSLVAGQNSLPRTPQRMHSAASSRLAKAFMSEAEDPDSPLLQNPWQSSREQLARPRQLETTISTPLLPTQTQTGEPSTPERPQISPRRSDRPSTFSRNSVARMMPGPFIAPLSSPLSAIVADSRRRGVDPYEPRQRPGLSTLKKSNSQRSTGVDDENDVESEGSPLKGAQQPGMALTEDSSTAKGRSFSVSLGEFFRLKRDKSSGSEDEGHRDGTEQEQSR